MRDGVVVAVGDDADVRRECDASTRLIDGAGLVLTPGLTDGHQHLFQGAEVAQGVDFDRVESLEGIRSRLRGRRAETGAGRWLLGFALAYEAFEGRAYHHTLIDDAAGDGPMLVYALDLHTAFVNGHALRLAGVDGPRNLGDGAIVVCDDAGRPTGELRERSAIDLVLRHLPAPTRAQRLSWYADAMARQNAVGITALHLMDGGPETVDLLAELESEGLLNLRVALHHFVTPATSDDELSEIIASRSRAGRRWRADGVKFMIDGVIDTGTAWLEEPDNFGDGREPMWPDPDVYRRRLRQVHDAGFRVATHAIGDRAVREVLDAYAGLPGGSAGRHRIEHIETAPDATIARFAPERVTASMQPIHLRWLKPDLSDPWSQRLDPRRCAHGMRSGDLSAAGALMVLGSDWPVAPFDPRVGFFAARLRRAPDVDDDRPIGASRPLTGEEVLAGYTVNPARVLGEERVAGRIRPGMRADLVGWGDDPVTCSAADITDLPVRLTIVAGQVVHHAAG
nr:amidohydrolase family protein [Planosporangium thailandense]